MTGQCTLVDPGNDPRAGTRRGRRNSLQSQSQGLEASPGAGARRPPPGIPEGGGSENAVAGGWAGGSSGALPIFAHGRSRRALTPFEAARKSVVQRVLAAPRNLLSRMLGSRAMDEEEFTIGPYVRFVWILSLGILDLFLVLVLLDAL